MVQIQITLKAKKDIKAIYKHIKKDSDQNAEMVAEAIIRKIDTLRSQPDFGKIVKEFKDPKIRELKLFKYRIIYRLNTLQSLEIIKIHHSSRLLNNNPHLKDLFE